MTNSQLPDLILRGQLPPHSEDKNIVSHVARYNHWLIETGQAMYLPDLMTYRDYLLTTLAPSSMRAHLPSIRRSYKLLIESLEHRQALRACIG